MSIAETDIDAVTAAWIRNPSDEAAVRNGCRFDVIRGSYTVWWIENVCKLYEGEQAGEPVVLRGCGQCDYELPTIYDWDEDGEAICIERARLHAECVAAGHFIDWQYECTMRVFGWVKWSDHWQQEIRRFRRSKIYVPKKSKKSPTLAAWGTYLTCGDGEPGQHVYFAAKDGAQARDNVGQHAVEMRSQSVDLMDETSLNLAKLQITHEPSRSSLKPLSSSNVRTQKSKEGLNGCVLIDETHVVDRPFVNRISRAGISRKEPLHGEFSTAGDDPDSYGMEEFQLCEKILSGETEAQDTFAAIYAAPQNLDDAELDSDPMKYIRMANPALGHTVNPEEILDDYQQSKESPAKLAQFKMYRLNIWQNSASPWLPMAGWDKGHVSFTADSLKGRNCWAALDLSSVCDFTAFCLAFPEEDEAIKFLWWFWLPEETARKIQHLIPIQKWKQDSRTQLFLTPGARINYIDIRNTVRRLHREYQIQELAYDDWNAEQTTSEISEGVRDSSGHVTEPATGIPRISFSQSMKELNEPSKQFEARVIDGKIQHNGDPLAKWMIQNATIKPDSNRNYKPLKPRDGTKKIDGVIVAIMAMARANMQQGGSVYASRGLISIDDESDSTHGGYHDPIEENDDDLWT